MTSPTIPPVSYESAALAAENDPGQRSQAMLAHLLGIIAILGPGIYYLVKKNDPTFGPFPRSQVKEVFNFNLAVFAINLGINILSAVLVAVTHSSIIAMLLGLVVLAIALGSLVLVIMAGMRANKGIATSYPIKLPVLK